MSTSIAMNGYITKIDNKWCLCDASDAQKAAMSAAVDDDDDDEYIAKRKAKRIVKSARDGFRRFLDGYIWNKSNGVWELAKRHVEGERVYDKGTIKEIKNGVIELIFGNFTNTESADKSIALILAILNKESLAAINPALAPFDAIFNGDTVAKPVASNVDDNDVEIDESYRRHHRRSKWF